MFQPYTQAENDFKLEALAELNSFLKGEGFDLTSSSVYSIRVWAGVPFRSVCISIIVPRFDLTWQVSSVNGEPHNSWISFDTPFEEVAKIIRRVLLKIS